MWLVLVHFCFVLFLMWLLTPQNSQSLLLSHPPLPHILGKLIRKPGCSFHKCWWEVQTTQGLARGWNPLPSPIPLNTINAETQPSLAMNVCNLRRQMPVGGQRGLHNKFQTSQDCLKNKQSKPTIPLLSQPFPHWLGWYHPLLRKHQSKSTISHFSP